MEISRPRFLRPKDVQPAGQATEPALNFGRRNGRIVRGVGRATELTLAATTVLALGACNGGRSPEVVQATDGTIDVTDGAATDTASPETGTVVPPVANADNQEVVIRDLGMRWFGTEDDTNYPTPPEDGAIVAHGDLDTSGKCSIKTFYPGDIYDLKDGTFGLVEVRGTREEIQLFVGNAIQPAAAQSSKDRNCPITKS